MIEIVIPAGQEVFNEATNKFIKGATEVRIQLEHSLVALSKWESKWEVPFLSADTKSTEQTLDYIKCMTLTPEVSPEVYDRLSSENITDIQNYISAKMTATWFSDEKSSGKSEIVTAEILYYWMISMNIPVEFQDWHINRLLALVRVTSNKNAPPKKMSRADALAKQRSLNAERKAKLGTTG